MGKYEGSKKADYQGLADYKAKVLKDVPERDRLLKSTDRALIEHERPEDVRAVIEAELKTLDAGAHLRKIERELDRYLDKKVDLRVRGIRQRRAERQPAEDVLDETRELLDTKSREVRQLETQLDYTYEQIIGFLPTETRAISSNGTETVRKATWDDIRLFLDSGDLESVILERIEAQEPDIDPDVAVRRANDLVRQTRDALAASEIIREERGEDLEAQEQTDAQKMLKFFRWFRLGELKATRVVRGHLRYQINRKEETLRKVYADGRVSYREIDALNRELADGRRELFEEVHSSPEAYYDYWGGQLLEAQRVFDEAGTIYETPTIKAKIAKIESMIDQGQPVFIHGETGTGKSELAKYIAKHKYGKEALLISGRRGMELAEMTEMRDIHVRIAKLPEVERVEIQTRVESALADPEFQARIEEHAHFLNQPVEEVRRAEVQKLEAAYYEYFKRPVEIRSRLQPIYEAARDGQIVIIDEMNAIPHHTLIALNDLLTKRPLDGATYTRYQAGEITAAAIDSHHKFRPVYGGPEIVIAPGFGVIATGNWKPEDGKAYVGRQTLDTAFMRRFGIVEYDYLANPTEGVLTDEVDTPEEERAKKEQAELFRMLSAQILRSEGPELTAEIPENAFDQLENLARVARLIQEGFSGGDLPDAYLPEAMTGTGGKLKANEVIHENVADLGKLTQYVIKPWKAEQFTKPLEVYIFNHYLTRSTAREAEFFYLYKLFQLHGFFKSDAGWPDLIDLGKPTPPPAPADPANPPPPPDPKQVADEMRQRSALRFKDVKQLVGDLERQVYQSADTVSYLEGEHIRWDKPAMEFYDAKMLVDRLVGRGPERSRYPDLARAVVREGQTIDTFEAHPEETAERFELRAWTEEVEAALLEVIENDQTDPLVALAGHLETTMAASGVPEPANMKPIVDQLRKFPEKARGLLAQVQDLGRGLDDQVELRELAALRDGIINTVNAWGNERI